MAYWIHKYIGYFSNIEYQISARVKNQISVGIKPICNIGYWSKLGPMNGVFPTPDTVPFFPSDTDIHPKTNVARHRHSHLVPRHLTPHFSPTLTLSFPPLDITQNFGSTPDTQTPFRGPKISRYAIPTGSPLYYHRVSTIPYLLKSRLHFQPQIHRGG